MGFLAGLVGYRTIIFNVLMALLYFAQKQGIITQLPSNEMLYAFIDVLLQNIPAILAGGNIILRFMTTTPVGKKPS